MMCCTALEIECNRFAEEDTFLPNFDIFTPQKEKTIVILLLKKLQLLVLLECSFS